MKIQPPVAEKRKSHPFVAFLAFLVLLGGAAFIALTLFYYKNASTVPDLNIQNFVGKVQISTDGIRWQEARRGDVIKPFTHFRTDSEGELDLKYGNSAFLRLKPSASAFYLPPSFLSSSQARIHLTTGNLLVSNTNEKLEFSVIAGSPEAPKTFYTDVFAKTITSEGTSIFMISANPGVQSASVHVLRGLLTVQSLWPKELIQVREMESAEKLSESPFKTLKIQQTDWKLAREAYEITQKTAAQEAIQLDLAKKAGNFFTYVLDHGTFYQQKFGWSEREFFAPEDGSAVYLENTYDVFPMGSWVGTYFKTRNLDISKFKKFKIEARQIPERPSPENIRIEFKAKYQVVQAFAIKKISPEWETIEFPLHVSKETIINEMVVIFSHEKVGSKKTGGVQFRNFTLVEEDKAVLEARAAAATAKTAPTPAKPSVDPRIAAVAENASAITKKTVETTVAAKNSLLQKAAEVKAAAAKNPDDFSKEVDTF